MPASRGCCGDGAGSPLLAVASALSSRGGTVAQALRTVVPACFPVGSGSRGSGTAVVPLQTPRRVAAWRRLRPAGPAAGLPSGAGRHPRHAGFCVSLRLPLSALQNTQM